MPQELDNSVLAEEVALVKRVGRGEREAIEALIRTYGGALFRFVYRLAGERYEDAQDLTQETLLAAHSLANTFDGSCSVLTWLCSLAKIKVADHFRRLGRQKSIPDARIVDLDTESAQALADFHRGAASIDDALERIDARAFLDRVTAPLHDDEREALLLHYVDGFSVGEMTLLQNRSAKGVESLLTRAKKKCRQVAAGLLTS